MDGNAMELISGLMNNPDAIDKIKNILYGTQTDVSVQSENTDNIDDNIAVSNNIGGNKIPDMSFISNLLSGNEQSVELMNRMKDAYDVYSNNSDPEVNLLNALTPYLSSTRIRNLETIKKIVRLGKATSVFAKR